MLKLNRLYEVTRQRLRMRKHIRIVQNLVFNIFLAPDCVMIIAIQPFEVMTQLCALNSVLPSHRIIAPGTMIDSAHFRLKLS